MHAYHPTPSHLVAFFPSRVVQFSVYVTLPRLQYGLSEDELKGIFAMRRDQPEAATVSHMASLYKIKDSEVKSILKYLSPVIPLP